MGDVDVVDMAPRVAAVVHGEVTMAELPEFFGSAFAEVADAVTAAGAELAGPPFGYYPRPPDDIVVVDAGFPTSVPLAPTGRVHAFELPGGPAAVAVHVGPYDTLPETYAELERWATERAWQLGDAMWEHYLSDQASDPATWRTQVVWPLRTDVPAPRR